MHQNPRPVQSKHAPKPDLLGAAVTDTLQELIVVSSIGMWALLKSFFSRKSVVTVPLTAFLAWGSLWVATRGLHIRYLHDLEPDLLIWPRLAWMYRIQTVYHAAFLFCLGISPLVLCLGMVARSIRLKFHHIFVKAALTNGVGDTPKLIYSKRLDKYRIRYVFDANGIGMSEFEAKQERIESHFRCNIESIKHAKHNGQVAVIFTKQLFPSRVLYQDLAAQKSLPKESLYLGVTVEGIKTQKIAELPHMLIAGTTGSGKSVFFKQALLGLLESSPYLQMYLIDLKGGLEMIDFVGAPNVKVIKTMDQAVHLLSLIEREMKNRFAYLEKSNRKQITPEEDKKDRIVVAVDEASVLYMTRSKHDPDYQASLDARRLADSISKLSRAAAIHLLIATQKLDRQVIPTSVSENISGRMAFRANSLQGSMIVLGSKDACELPEIPGRGIWSYGTRKMIIQSPYAAEEIIKERCEQVATLFKEGKRKMFNPMIGETEKTVDKAMMEDVYGAVEERK